MNPLFVGAQHCWLCPLGTLRSSLTHIGDSVQLVAESGMQSWERHDASATDAARRHVVLIHLESGIRSFVSFLSFSFFSFSLSIIFYDACSSTPPAVLTTPHPPAAHNRATLVVRACRREPRRSVRLVTHPHPHRHGQVPSTCRRPPVGWAGAPRVGRPAPAPPVAVSGYGLWESQAQRRGSPQGARSTRFCLRGTKTTFPSPR